MRTENQTALSRIWTRLVESISYDDHYGATSASQFADLDGLFNWITVHCKIVMIKKRRLQNDTKENPQKVNLKQLLFNFKS